MTSSSRKRRKKTSSRSPSPTIESHKRRRTSTSTANKKHKNKHKKVSSEVDNNNNNHKTKNNTNTTTNTLNDKELYFGYSNENNPYNDTNLTELFVWHKKFEEQGFSNKQIKKLVNKRLADNRESMHYEILNTKKRRREREIEQEAQERLKEEIEKEMQLEDNAGWQEKEEEFHEQNAIKRSQIRVNESREKPIDILVRVLYDFPVSGPIKTKRIIDPIATVDYLELHELAILLQEIEEFIQLSKLNDEEEEELQQENNEAEEEETNNSHSTDPLIVVDKQMAFDYWNYALCYCLHVYKIKNNDPNYVSYDPKSRNSHNFRSRFHNHRSYYRHNNNNNNSSSNSNSNSNSSVPDEDLLLYNEMNKEFKLSTYEQVCTFWDDCQFMAQGKPELTSQQFSQISVDVDYWERCVTISTIIKASKYISQTYQQLLALKEQQRQLKNQPLTLQLNQITMKDSKKISMKDAQLCFTNDISQIPQFAIPKFLEQTKILDSQIPEIMTSGHPQYSTYLNLNEVIDAEQQLLNLEMQRFSVLKVSIKKLQSQMQSQKKIRNSSHTLNNNNDSTSNSKKEEETEQKSEKVVKVATAQPQSQPQPQPPQPLLTTRYDPLSFLAIQNANKIVLTGDEMFSCEANKAMPDGHMSYNRNEIAIPDELHTTYWWHDKYRARKPRYFNRVKTGYSWNKYNQTHYDPDNPPPKIVQGYKFNLFFPDLIDNKETPSYKLYEKLGEEYATLVFHSGPPYEDIAFKIVNNEWESSHRRGFRCRFEKGIFSLYFNFRRYRYRR